MLYVDICVSCWSVRAYCQVEGFDNHPLKLGWPVVHNFRKLATLQENYIDLLLVYECDCDKYVGTVTTSGSVVLVPAGDGTGCVCLISEVP
jgi:hypothetical protein